VLTQQQGLNDFTFPGRKWHYQSFLKTKNANVMIKHQQKKSVQ
jgi:hypothetical protein